MLLNKSRHLRKNISKEIVIGIGARDALEAKIIENAEFDFVWAGSLGISASYAVPDASFISMKQFLEAARSMNEVIRIPVIADVDTGYGNVNNVMYTVKLFEEAGIAGMCIEDNKFPKQNSLEKTNYRELESIETFCNKLKVAKGSQKSKDFLVIARVEALIANLGQEEAMKRAIAYSKAGADFIMMHSHKTKPDEIIKFVTDWEEDTPLTLIPTTYPTLSEKKIREMGKVKMIIYANQVLRAAVRVSENVLKKIKRDQGIHKIDDLLTTFSHIFELQGVPQMKEKNKRILE